MLRKLLKRLGCRHDYLATNEGWPYFGKDHITKVCVKCGKRSY